MKKGMILYVTQGKEDVPLQEVKDLVKVARSFEVTAVCVAVSEEDVVYGWWQLVTKGMHQIFFMAVSYDPAMGVFGSRGTPKRLCG